GAGRDASGRIVLIDVGSGLATASADGPVAGTPLYLAPEVLEGGPATVPSDIYAVGILLYHLLTGRFPVEGATLAEVRDRHRDRSSAAPVDTTRTIPPRVRNAIARAIARDPSTRYPSAAAFEDALTRAMKPLVRRLPLAAAAIVFIATVSALAWNARPRA